MAKKRLTKIERQLQRQVNGHTVILTAHELYLIEEAVKTYMKEHCDDWTCFEFQALLDDIEQIRMEWECEA